jgi:hypothetical protein
MISSVMQIAPNGIIQNQVDGGLRDELAQLSQIVIRAEYDALASGKDLSRTHIRSTQYQKVAQRVTDIRTSMADDGLRYTNYTLDLQVEGVWATNETATVIWTEKVVFDLAGDPDPNAPKISFETKTHLTSLRRDADAWYIEGDDENFGTPSLTFDAYSMPNVISDQPATVERKYQTYMPIAQNFGRNESMVQIAEHALTGEAQVASTLASYSRDRASAYAATYGQSGGMDGYRDFGNNCTNFISRCLYAGGWPHKSGYYKSTDGWWYHGIWPTYAAYPWHNCHYWYWFTQNTQRGTRLNNIWDLLHGDILLYDFHKDGYCDHAAICHHRSSRGTIYMAQHTFNYAWRSLSEIVAGKNWWFYPWRMKTSF